MSDGRLETFRACLTCAHFEIDEGSPEYGELTPGSPMDIRCRNEGKRGCAWTDHPDFTAMALRTIAERCALYEMHRDLAPTAGTGR